MMQADMYMPIQGVQAPVYRVQPNDVVEPRAGQIFGLAFDDKVIFHDAELHGWGLDPTDIMRNRTHLCAGSIETPTDHVFFFRAPQPNSGGDVEGTYRFSVSVP